MTEMQLILTMTLQCYALELAPDQLVALALEATLRPRHGMRLNLRPVTSAL